MSKKLKFKEFMIVSKILNQIDVLTFIGKVEFKNNQELGIKLVGYFFQNMYLAEETIKELIMSYSDINELQFEEMDGDGIIEVFNEMYKNGLPEMIKKIFANNQEAKKK